MKAPQFPRDTPLICWEQQTKWAVEAFGLAFTDDEFVAWWRIALETLKFLKTHAFEAVPDILEFPEVADIFFGVYDLLVYLAQLAERASPRLVHFCGPFLGRYLFAGLLDVLGRDDWASVCPRRCYRLFRGEHGEILNPVYLAPDGDPRNFATAVSADRQQILEYFNLALAPRAAVGRTPGSHSHPPLAKMVQALRDLQKRDPEDYPSRANLMRKLGRSGDPRRVNEWLAPRGVTYKDLLRVASLSPA